MLNQAGAVILTDVMDSVDSDREPGVPASRGSKLDRFTQVCYTVAGIGGIKT